MRRSLLRSLVLLLRKLFSFFSCFFSSFRYFSLKLSLSIFLTGSMEEDPFLQVKGEVVQQTASLKALHARWKQLMQNPQGVNECLRPCKLNSFSAKKEEGEFAYLVNEIQGISQAISWDLSDLSGWILILFLFFSDRVFLHTLSSSFLPFHVFTTFTSIPLYPSIILHNFFALLLFSFFLISFLQRRYEL